MEAISARDANVNEYPTITITKVQIKPAVPPLVKAKAVALHAG
jgi:hypothetical protein